MTIIIYLIPVALALGLLGLGAFVWSIRSGQFDDMQGPAYRILDNDDDTPAWSSRRLSAHEPRRIIWPSPCNSAY